ncbi:recombinase family protein, partial [Magnetospirillum moscoviense]|uniref:recombinase family protein n=1 Tax=Magnetospirillum moscoviense TaxID=1437059 RepID=UPI00156089D1
MPVSPRVILYGRFSDERQNPSSARDQIAACEARAGLEGWHVVDRFSDEAISGAVKLRPGYQALRQAVVDGKADIVMAEALDRLSRDQEETANL